MALERQDASTSIQPSGPVPATGAKADADVAGSIANEYQAIGNQWAEVGQIATRVMHEESLRQAQEHAPNIVQRDEQGNLIKPATFTSGEFGGLTYHAAYRKAAMASYQGAVISDTQKQADLINAKNPGNPRAVSEGMISYTDETLKNLDVTMANVLKPQLQAISAGAVNAATIAEARVNQQAFTVNAARSYETLLTSAVNTQIAINKGGMSTESQTQARANIEQLWQIYKDQARPLGNSEATFATKRLEFDAVVGAKVEAEKIYNELSQGGYKNPAFVASVQQRIKDYGDKNSAYRIEVMPFLEAAYSRGMNIVSQIQAAHELRFEDTRGGIMALQQQLRDMTNANTAAKERGESEPYNADTIAQTRSDVAEKQRMEVAKGNFTPMQRAILYGDIGQSRAIVETNYATVLSQQTSIYKDPQTSPDARAAALSEITRFVNNPQVQGLAAGSLHMQNILQQGRNVVADSYIGSITKGIADVHQNLSQGNIQPDRMAEYMKKVSDAGMVGDRAGQISTGAFVKLIETNNTMYAEKQRVQSIVREHLAAGADPTNPVIPSSSAQDLIQKQYPFHVNQTDEHGNTTRVTPNINNDKYNAQALAYYKTTSVVPTKYVDALRDVTGATDPVTKAKFVSIMQTFQKHTDAKFGDIRPNPITGTPQVLEMSAKNQIVHAIMKTQFGDVYDMYNALTKHGVDAPPALIAKELEKDTPSRENSNTRGQTEAQVKTVLAGKFITPFQSPGGAEIAGGMAASFLEPIVRSLPLMFGREAMLKLDLFNGSYNRALIEDVFNASGITSATRENLPIRMHPNAQNILVDYVHQYLQGRGKTDTQNGIDPITQGIVTGLISLKNQMAVTTEYDSSGNPSGYTITRDPFFHSLNRTLGTNMNEEQAREVVASVVKYYRPDLFGREDPDSSSKHIRIAQENLADGTSTYGVYTTSLKTGHSQFVANIHPSDPIFKREMLSVYQAVALEMKNSKLAGFFNILPGAALWQSYLAENIRDSLIKQGSGIALPSEQYVALVDGVRQAIGKAYRGGPLADFSGRDYDAQWETIKKGQNAIGRYGTLWYMLTGGDEDYIRKLIPQHPSRPFGEEPPGTDILGATKRERAAAADARSVMNNQAEMNRLNRTGPAVTSTPPPDWRSEQNADQALSQAWRGENEAFQDVVNFADNDSLNNDERHELTRRYKEKQAEFIKQQDNLKKRK